MEGFAALFEKRGETRGEAWGREKLDSAKKRYIQECLDTGRAKSREEAERMAEAIFQ